MALNLDEPDQQGNGVRAYPKDLLGHLLLVWAIEYIEHAPTQFTKPGQPSDVVVVDVVDFSDLDQETGEPIIARCTWWRQAQLIKSMKGKIGRDPVLVSMGKGSAAIGKSQPFVLTSQTQNESAVKMAQDWAAAHPDFEPSKPMPRAPVQEEAPADPWAGQTDPGISLPPARPAGVPTGPTPNQESMLERMARQSQQGKDWAASRPLQQGDIPF